jgi:hypothetical protein
MMPVAAARTATTGMPAGLWRMSVAAVMFPAVPAFTAAEAEAATEFITDNVPAGTIPAVVIPPVSLAIGDIAVVTALRDRGRGGAARPHHQVRVD